MVLELEQLRVIQKEMVEDFLIIEVNLLESLEVCILVYDRFCLFFTTFLENEKVPTD